MQFFEGTFLGTGLYDRVPVTGTHNRGPDLLLLDARVCLPALELLMTRLAAAAKLAKRIFGRCHVLGLGGGDKHEGRVMIGFG